jgi:hypothetical protein
MANRYGVDVEYFKKELSKLSQSLDNRTPEELQLYLLRLADVAIPSALNGCNFSMTSDKT